jgi:hypothetical protein
MARRSRTSAALAALVLVLLAAPALSQARSGSSPSPASAAARSLVLPGWGQWAQRQHRAVAYAAVEAAAWAFWADRRGQGGDLRGRYRALAWQTGRIPSGERRDGEWAYYEALCKWTRSGAFDRDTSLPGIQPEEDPSTFNGSMWALAKGIYFRGASPAPGDPSYETALAWYRARAYSDGFLWDWRGREGELAEYRQLIRRSDDRFREATTAMGAVLGNHLLSGADAFVSARIPGSAELRLLAPAAATSAPLWLTLSWRPPR